MTPRPEKTTLTPDRVLWFATYLRRHPAWGIFHTALTLHNYTCGTADERFSAAPWTTDEREAATWFDQLTPSQRKRLRERAEDLAGNVLWKGAS